MLMSFMLVFCKSLIVRIHRGCFKLTFQGDGIMSFSQDQSLVLILEIGLYVYSSRSENSVDFYCQQQQQCAITWTKLYIAENVCVPVSFKVSAHGLNAHLVIYQVCMKMHVLLVLFIFFLPPQELFRRINKLWAGQIG